jgi:hypothetical protein
MIAMTVIKVMRLRVARIMAFAIATIPMNRACKGRDSCL